MGAQLNNKVPASERRGIIVLAFIIAAVSIILGTCESGMFHDTVVFSESPADTQSIPNKPAKPVKKTRKKQKSKKEKIYKTVKPRSPLDEPISEYFNG